MSKQKRTPSIIEDSDEELEDKPTGSKKPKKPSTKGVSAAKKPKPIEESHSHSEGSDDEGMLPLSNKRFVSVSVFHGKTMVNIREYYSDEPGGPLKPGRKGISLNVDQWQKLVAHVPKVQEMLKKS